MSRFCKDLTALALLALAACSRTDAEPRPTPDPTPSAPVKVTPPPGPSTAPTPVASAPTGPMILARGLRITHAGSGSDAAKVVHDEQLRAKTDGRDVVVYVGAKWCEPCQRFHKAADAGLLDTDFPTLTLLEFDLDEDRERLMSAGYVSDFIPLFALPSADGRASGKQFSGSIKGDGAVANITPRLRGLLSK